MIKSGIVGEVIERTGCSPLWVVTAEDYLGDAGQYDSPHAHRTRLEGDIQDSFKKPPRTKFSGGFSDGNQLGVSCRVLTGFTQVMGAGNDSVTLYDNAADRHLVLGLGLARFGDGIAHPVFVGARRGGLYRGAGECNA